MNLVFQTNIHTEHKNGNCMRASLSSIFELNIDEIPLFEEMKKNEWKREFCLWLNSLGLSLVEEFEQPKHNQLHIAIGHSKEGYCIASSLSLEKWFTTHTRLKTAY